MKNIHKTLILLLLLLFYCPFMAPGNVFYYITVIKGDNMKQQEKRGSYNLSELDIKKVINGADNLRNRIILKLLAYTGARRAEIAGIETDKIDLQKMEILIKGKGEKERTLFLTPDLAAELNIFIGAKPRKFLFTSKIKTHRPITTKTINMICQSAGETAGIKNPTPGLKHLNPHLFRHSFARALKRKNIGIETISQVLGHQNPALTISTYGLPSHQEIKADILKALA